MREPVALVGRACVLPGALDAASLARVVLAGEERIRDVPSGRWRLDPASVLGPGRMRPAASAEPTGDARYTDRTTSMRGGYVTGFAERFDPAGFAIPASEIEPLDPLFQWLLHATREALDDARCGPHHRARAGLFVGNLSYPSASLSRRAERQWIGGAAESLVPMRVEPRDRFVSGLPPALVARALGLGGPAFAIDAACASSLYAIAIACDRLARGEIDLAISGGINAADDLFLHVGFTALGALSPTGRSLPLRADGDGLLPGEGVALVVLERLSDARRNGRSILGLVRGVGLANDGRGRGFLAPLVKGQVRAMRQAYERAGLAPDRVGLVECHATGTPIGDGTEIASLAGIFAGRSDVPVGSLKALLGHLITAAGGAGLLKVIAAMESETLPPSGGAGDPHAALEGTPFRLLERAEPWERGDQPRVAAVSAFGFGGNNAHLLVEQWEEPSTSVAVAQGAREDVQGAQDDVRDAPRARIPIAIVAAGARVGEGTCLGDFARQLFLGTSALREVPGFGLAAPARDIVLPLGRLRFPPADLQQSLAQQSLLLAAAFEAVDAAGSLSPERTGAFVGMGGDPEAARYSARWHLDDWMRSTGRNGAGDEERDGIVAALRSAGVIGAMPNVPANRLNAQFDWGGPSFTVSAEELSGIRALEVAMHALEAGELDAALVGATDLSVEPVHAAAARELLPPSRRAPGDAAIVLVLKRLDDARRAGDAVLAQVEILGGACDDAEQVTATSEGLELGFGAGPLARPLGPMFGHAHAASGLLHVLAGASCVAHGALPGEGGRIRPWQSTGPRTCLVTIGALGDQRAAVRLAAAGEPEPFEALLSRFDASSSRVGVGDMLRLPAHAAPVRMPHELSVERMAPAPPLPPVLPPLPIVAGEPEPALAAVSASLPSPVALLVQAHARVASVHRAFLAEQQVVHDRFLEMRERSAALLRSFGGLEAGVAPTAPARGDGPRGPTFDRAALEVHASGRISSLFGPRFSEQDAHAVQVRMPQPPLLLADRVTGIDAEPGSMGVGTIWTETDVEPGSWYLHDGRMPAGILVESGQADLFLISYLGVDLLHHGRAYRLLGCELTFEGPLPRSGEVLKFRIVIDGHARQGDVRLFFFHYDCTGEGGRPVLKVRGGQAGFFTTDELSESGGVLWSAETAEPLAGARVDTPSVRTTRRALDAEQVRAFAGGDAFACFGPGFERASAHVRTPRFQAGRMQLVESVDVFDPAGGPWQRGYLRATLPIRPDAWFFAGHFKGDPCMPGTLMLEGCLQALSIYLAAAGATLDRDGYRFEPGLGERFLLACRGQVTPASRSLRYEVFVEELHLDAGEPRVVADLLCTVDGLKAFHARRVSLRLVPDWPLTSRPDVAVGVEDGEALVAHGHRFDHASLLACAWGRPTDAFGPMYARFNGIRRVARLPGPPYHFMTRIVSAPPGMGRLEPGLTVVSEYDVPRDAWYFDEGSARTMPFAVLLEAALQPCGWLASYAGSALSSDADLAFRNLDGRGTLHAAIGPDVARLRVEAKLVRVSHSAGMIIEAFEVELLADGVETYSLETVFGFFPPEALKNQAGLPVSAAQQASLDAPASFDRDVRSAHPERKLHLLDRVSAFEPQGGTAGKGFLRAERRVKPSDWWFRAHFFQDPVQPGSLGLEAILQLVEIFLVESGATAGMAAPRFEPVALGEAHAWKFRGQVLPEDGLVTITMDVLDVVSDDRGVATFVDASLWIDGRRIYEVTRFGRRVADGGRGDEVLDLSLDRDAWLRDHRPTYTRPALPMMSVADRLLGAAGDGAVGLEDVSLSRWIVLGDEPLRLRADVVSEDGHDIARLLVSRPAMDGRSGRLEPVARARLLFHAAPIEPLPPLEDGIDAGDPYASGALFHGASFRYLRSLRVGRAGASAVLDLARGTVPPGAWHQGLLDASTHAIPHDALERWAPEIGGGWIGFPHRIERLVLLGPAPLAGTVECEVRFAGFAGETRFPRFQVQLQRDGRVIADMMLVEVLMPRGPIGSAPPLLRRGFLRDRLHVPGLGLSRTGPGADPGADVSTVVMDADIAASDWFPGTIAAAYGAPPASSMAKLAIAVALKEHVARACAVHPAHVDVETNAERGTGIAVAANEPLTAHALAFERALDGVSVRHSGPPRFDADRVLACGRERLGFSDPVLEDLHRALLERFVRRVRLVDPACLPALRGRSAIFLANHQVMIESPLFGLAVEALTGVRTAAIAKAEHADTWLGRLIAHVFSDPRARAAAPLLYFDRADPGSLPRLLEGIAAEMLSTGLGLLVHVEGTRSLSCRTPVARMSGALLDVALRADVPVVPVRFVGGLPIEPAEARLDFPHGMGAQEYILGAPIAAADLARLTYRERQEIVIDAINSIEPRAGSEEPSTPDPVLAAAVGEWRARTGVDLAHAVLREALARLEEPSATTRAILDAAATGELRVRDDEPGRFAAELARRLFGPRGPRVHLETSR